MIDKIIFHYPRRLVFGLDSIDQFAKDFIGLPYKRLFLLSISPLANIIGTLKKCFEEAGISVVCEYSIINEPTFSDFEELLVKARKFNSDSIVGIGGGSVMDVAKLLAAWLHNDEPVSTAIGNGLVPDRKVYLALLPSTAGTGSEVSPNAILLDERDSLKKAVISPFLIPDGAYVDPVLTFNVPPKITAATGIDALTHCLEAYANRFSHPMTDIIALEGIRLISDNLRKACDNGKDREARSAIALGSLYGGMCLGPVNTAAVHALAYPLGSEYKVAHGISNALLLPHVLRFNLSCGVDRYYSIAKAVGAEEYPSKMKTAIEGTEKIAKLCKDVGIPDKLSEFNVTLEAVPSLAKSAMKVQRLLKNNLREITEKDAREIYYKLF